MPKSDVALRFSFRQQRAVDDLAGVAVLQDPQRQAFSLLESCLDRLGIANESCVTRTTSFAGRRRCRRSRRDERERRAPRPRNHAL